jgi:hypothetical protein
VTAPRIHIEVEIPGQPVLRDPSPAEVVRAMQKDRCRHTLELHAERVEHFKGRLAHHGADLYALVLLNVDDPNGAILASQLMPGHDWSPERNAGQVPFARGLAERAWLIDVLALFDGQAYQKLKDLPGPMCVVVDFGVAEVFPL